MHLQPPRLALLPSHRRCFLLQYPSFKSSDTENLSLTLDMDDEDDVSTDDDEDVSFPPATDTDSATAPRLSWVAAAVTSYYIANEISSIVLFLTCQNLKFYYKIKSNDLGSVLVFSGIRSESGDPVENVKPVYAGKTVAHVISA